MVNNKIESARPRTWILQPVSVTMMRHDYSLRQTRILEKIVEKMQSKMIQMINLRKQITDVLSEEDLDIDGRFQLIMDLKDFKGFCQQKQIIEDIKYMTCIPVEIPYKTYNGIRYFKITNLFDVYFIWNRNHEWIASLKFEADVVNKFFSMDFGFHRICKQVIYACHHRSSQRLYMYLESWYKVKNVSFSTFELRRMLRLENRYKRFSDFAKWVINPAKEELEILANRGICDLYFDYEKESQNKSCKEDSDIIVFHIQHPED